MPPPYSAKKIAGTPAYKLAREGKPVELKPPRFIIARFEIVALDGAEASFTMSISAGGYVRSVAHELGQELGCGAHLSSLRRTQAGVFTLAEAHTLEELQPLAGNVEALEELCVHPRSLLPEMPSVTGDAVRSGTAAQRRAGQPAGVFRRAAGEGLCRPARAGGNCKASGRNAVSAGGGAQWSVNSGQ